MIRNALLSFFLLLFMLVGSTEEFADFVLNLLGR